MELRREGNGLVLYAGEELVANARPTKLDITVPESPSFAAAELSSQRYRGFQSHFYPGCFVCGPEREYGDGLRIFAGPLDTEGETRSMVAATWVPDNSLTDDSGFVAPEFIWASLDCPGAYSFPEPEKGAILLGELAVDIRKTVSAGEKCVLIGWEISQSGRKHFTGTALFGESGGCCAVGYATWFEVPTQPAQ